MYCVLGAEDKTAKLELVSVSEGTRSAKELDCVLPLTHQWKTQTLDGPLLVPESKDMAGTERDSVTVAPFFWMYVSTFCCQQKWRWIWFLSRICLKYRWVERCRRLYYTGWRFSWWFLSGSESSFFAAVSVRRYVVSRVNFGRITALGLQSRTLIFRFGDSAGGGSWTHRRREVPSTGFLATRVLEFSFLCLFNICLWRLALG